MMHLLRRNRGAEPASALTWNAHSEPSEVYRRFLYLDAEAILDWLAVLQGGQVLYRFQRSVAKRGGDLGGHISLAGIGAKGSWRMARELEEQVEVVATTHSAVQEILSVLARRDRGDRDAILTGCPKNGLEKLENDVYAIRFVSLDGLTPADPCRSPDHRWQPLRWLTGDRSQPGRTFSAQLATQDQGWRVCLTGNGEHLQVPAHELACVRHATVLGQIDVAHDGEEVQSAPALDGGTAYRIVAVDHGADDKAGATSMPAPVVAPTTASASPPRAVIVTPLCIYK